MEYIRAFGMKMFELGSKATALGLLLCFLVMAVDLCITLFPHEEKLFPYDSNHLCDP